MRLNTPSPVIVGLLVGLMLSMPVQAQGWSPEQLALANTAESADFMTPVEKEAVLYINLCRLYPKEFLTLEVIPYAINPDFSQAYQKEFVRYKQSLGRELESRNPVGVLQVDRALFEDAKCYAKEISTQNRRGHQRRDCEKNDYAECISYGPESGKDIALQWLFDVGVGSLGHRQCCLDQNYAQIGLCTETHFEFDHCAVAEFR